MRVFVAIALGAAARGVLAAWADALASASTAGVRFTEAESYHLTLAFVGDVPGERVDEVVACAWRAARSVAPFPISLGGLGAFPDVSRPRVVYAAVAGGDAALGALARGVADELREAGVPVEDRPFVGHVTLGRAREPEDVDALAAALAARGDDGARVEIAVDAVDVFESVRGGPVRYRSLSRAPLSG